MLWGREPVLYLTLVEVILILAVGFGLDLNEEQMTAIIATAAAVLGLVKRQQVTPSRWVRAETERAYLDGLSDAGDEARGAS